MIQPRQIERPTLLIRQIRLIGLLPLEPLRYIPNGERLRRIRLPLRLSPVSQEVLVVEKKLLKAGSGNIEKAQLGL